METGWWVEHWHEVLEGVGIVGGLLFTGVTVRHDLQARKITEFLTQASQHRRLWSALHRRPELAHVLDADRDLTARPLSVKERRYLELVMTHFHTGWLIAREGHSLVSLKEVAADAGHFFRLPAPAAVWAEIREIHQPEFVEFVDRAVASLA